MKKRILFLCFILSLFSMTACAAPDFDKPVEITGRLYHFSGNDFFINDHRLRDLNPMQEAELLPLVGRAITIKGFYEKERIPFKKAHEIYVTEIIVE